MSTNATATITANIGRIDETKTFEGGRRLASFSACVNRRYKAGGQAVEAQDWYQIQTNNPALIELIERASVGERLCVTGPISLKKFDRKDGSTGMQIEIWADRIYYVDGKREDSKAGDTKTASGADLDNHVPF